MAIILNGIETSFMQQALNLAETARGKTSPNPTVGAVIVRDNRVIGQGYHARAGADHAEVAAIKDAEGDVAGATVFVTLEPCCHTGRTGPCSRALIESGVSRVVIASMDPSPKVDGKGAAELREAGIAVDVLECSLAERARSQNEDFRKHSVTGLPFVLFKSAMSLDGKIATGTGDSQWISGEDSRALVHELRAGYDAIAVGSGTAAADDPMLTCRLPGEHRQPLRVVFDSAAGLSPDSKLVKTAAEVPTLVFTTEAAAPERVQALRGAGVEVEALPAVNGRVDAAEAMRSLGSREVPVLSVMLEGGPGLAASFVEAGLIDKVMFFIAPKILGGESARTPVEGSGFSRVDDALILYRMKHEEVGEDILITAYTTEEGY
ncbi:MAG: bifunctional diaminohydroxyphosphoribosylaminopyrimidine deaminase/5-amino-6-(5-phosphoribosylamino)uracil reductase RibD [Gaiellales bacterium]|nr:MAG: bifunctional diaminohydroxyphosphoribosylaminopyrimidine deaminase/5-amino-6-(5-phosphoribosylamino)uracil reductase RibD [Gaiellales bacterium]